MTRAPAKTAASAAKPAGSSEMDGSAAPAQIGAPVYVRLIGIGSRAGGVLLPIGKSLQVGVDIPEAMASARLADETAEIVTASAVSAQAVRDAFAAFAKHVQDETAKATAQVAVASDAELLEVASLDHFGSNEEGRRIADQLFEALRRHDAAIGDEATAPPAAAPVEGEQPA